MSPGGSSWLTVHLIQALFYYDLGQEFLFCSPEELLNAVYTPSLWHVWDTTGRVLLITAVGRVTSDNLLRATANVHRSLAHIRPKREPYVRYPGWG